MKGFIQLTNESGTKYFLNVCQIVRFLLEPGRSMTTVYVHGKESLNAKETVAQIQDLIKASQAA